VKSTFKYTGIFAATLFYCLVMSMAGRDNYFVPAADSPRPATEISGISKVSSDLHEQSVQSLQGSTVKSSPSHSLKLPFNGLYLSAQAVKAVFLPGFSQFVKSFGDGIPAFGSIDIIYPFHSFW
jgi:hypothetical protein